METLDCLKLRQSYRAYTDDQIPDSALRTLLRLPDKLRLLCGIYDSFTSTAVGLDGSIASPKNSSSNGR